MTKLLRVLFIQEKSLQQLVKLQHLRIFSYSQMKFTKSLCMGNQNTLAWLQLVTKSSKGHVWIYITLEPCSTHGKTPPCSNAIIEGGFKRVVFGINDPDPRHQGNSMQILRKQGYQFLGLRYQILLLYN